MRNRIIIADSTDPWRNLAVEALLLDALGPDERAFYLWQNANTVVVGRHQNAYAEIDLSIAVENMWLETDAQGLGGVWLGIAPIEDRMLKVERVLGIPDTLRAFAIFPLGYPAEERKQQNRYDAGRIHYI